MRRGKGSSRQPSPPSPQPGAFGVLNVTSGTAADTGSCHHRPGCADSCPDAVGSPALRLLPGGTRDGEEDGVDGWGEMSRRGEEGLPCLPPAPPHTAGCGVGSCITASPPAPGPGALECCHKCHTVVRSQPAPARRRLVPLLSPAWFSLACFLCHTVQSLGFGGGCSL